MHSMIGQIKMKLNEVPFPLILLISQIQSCSTLSNREKTLLTMGTGAVVGGIVGSLTSPNDESEIAHGAMWAGITAASVGVVSLFVFNDDKINIERERQVEVLSHEVAALRGEVGFTPDSNWREVDYAFSTGEIQQLFITNTPRLVIIRRGPLSLKNRETGEKIGTLKDHYDAFLTDKIKFKTYMRINNLELK